MPAPLAFRPSTENSEWIQKRQNETHKTPSAILNDALDQMRALEKVKTALAPTAAAQNPETQIPFEADRLQRSTIGLNDSVASPQASTDTPTLSAHGNTDTTRFSERQEQILAFDLKRAEIKIRTARAIEAEKRETARQKDFRRPQQRPVMLPSAPDKHAAVIWGFPYFT